MARSICFKSENYAAMSATVAATVAASFFPAKQAFFLPSGRFFSYQRGKAADRRFEGLIDKAAKVTFDGLSINRSWF